MNPQPQTTPPTRTPPFREDCWTEDATSTLVDSWGRRYLDLNRGNLRQKDWQDVADAVNILHGLTHKTRRTDVQCKNRIDTLKKKYKVEKAKIVESNGALTSSWPFYSRLELLIGSNYDKLQIQDREREREKERGSYNNSNNNNNNNNNSNSNSNNSNNRLAVSPLPLALGFGNAGVDLGNFDSPPMAVPLPYSMRGKMGLGPPVAAMVQGQMGQKRSAGAMEGDFRRNYSAMAAAAAKAGMEEEDEGEEDEGEEGEEEEGEGEEEGMRKLAKAIERFGEIYERVEEMKQRQMVELEKQRMQFTKDLEVQRMQLFMDTQVQLEKIKRAKHSGGGSADELCS